MNPSRVVGPFKTRLQLTATPHPVVTVSVAAMTVAINAPTDLMAVPTAVECAAVVPVVVAVEAHHIDIHVNIHTQ